MNLKITHSIKQSMKKQTKKSQNIKHPTSAQAAQKKLTTIEDCFFLLGCIFAAIALILAAIWASAGMPNLAALLPPCLFHQISGYDCPGCGGTRAVRALLRGHLLQSALYHPFVPYAAAVYLYFMATQAAERISRGKLKIGMRYQNKIVWIAVGIILGNFLLKNILHVYGIPAL